MQALPSYGACIMKKIIQYTLRNVPVAVDDALRKQAVREGASLNAAALDALKAGAGVEEDGVRFHDLDTLSGTWVNDEAFDAAQRPFNAIEDALPQLARC
jgi:hypothetical protein